MSRAFDVVGASGTGLPRTRRGSWLLPVVAFLTASAAALASGPAAFAAEQGGASGTSARNVPSTDEQTVDESGDDCTLFAWSCETSAEVSKESARCACGDVDGACARQACRRAEEHPSAAVRREQALSRRRVEACQRGDESDAGHPKKAGRQRSTRPTGK